jgi:hypothetical protein
VRIGLVGGLQRSEPSLRRQAEELGHELRFHSGRVGRRGSSQLDALIRSVELVIVLTDVNSHGAVQLARATARTRGVPVAPHRRCSPERFASIVSKLA